MANVTSLTFGGLEWIPQFVQSINKDTCLGCGRCFKVCGQKVLALMGVNEEGEFIDDEDEDELERKVMTIVNQAKCIGCEACARICPKNCYTHAPLPA
ncbi:ferredoxin III, nif-specific [Rippkaea orientalis PCC 8801]|uniref:Ferredoxin III n=1 Tax=Rippkaea orientalis (strain PCC 8801 / RF-1) TaxID=41431 RepID=B7JWZ9_RIPO1|nr:ferredoxin III, nif-specific [Rippkaea orientalis]ACK65848.1 ferredoxin III, nif-specific [Rippkaea orientalis PCC 8801]